MRLYKKAAAVLLAAAMAVSMMTACGGGAGGGNGGNGGNTGAIPSAPTPEEIVLPKDDGEDESTPTKTPLDKANSWLVTFQNKVANASAVYFAGSQSSYSAAGTQTEELKMVMASTAGKAAYVDMTGWGLEGGKREDHVITLYVESGKAPAVYALNKSAKAGIKVPMNPGNMGDLGGDFDFSDIEIPANIYLTEVQIGGTKYRAETYVQDGNEYYTCFGTDKRPKYQITKKQNGGTDVSAYQEIVLNSDMGMCNLTGYTIYTASNDTQGNMILVNGDKTYNVVIDKSTGKVTVKCGESVAAEDFDWLADLLNEFGKLSGKS